MYLKVSLTGRGKKYSRSSLKQTSAKTDVSAADTLEEGCPPQFTAGI